MFEFFSIKGFNLEAQYEPAVYIDKELVQGNTINIVENQLQPHGEV